LASIIVDTAGARIGGARRFMDELDAYLLESARQDITLIGAERSLTSSWMIARERKAGRRLARVVALNNVSFAIAGRERVVLLRNALHFPYPGERFNLPPKAALRRQAQAAVIRGVVHRADVVVVPTSGMASRVKHHLPQLDSRIRVRPHPVSARQSDARRVPGRVVCPVVFAPYKSMGARLNLLAEAAAITGADTELVVTATAEQLKSHRVTSQAWRAVGQLTTAEINDLLASASVIYYPTEIESFGYPLAEARVNRQPVLALDNEQNREVAGSALVPFDPDVASLAQALSASMHHVVPAASAAGRDAYFDDLFALS
jgi:hypothetical protein